MSCGIYCIENIITGKKYIGASRNVEGRWLGHKHNLRNGDHHNEELQKDWLYYGESSFKHFLIEECDEEELDDKEKYYIQRIPFHYNVYSGGGTTKGSKVGSFPEETKQKMYENRKGKKPTRTEAVVEGYKVVSQKLTGKKKTEEHIKHLSESLKGKVPWNATKVFCVESGITYTSIQKASDTENVKSCQIQKCLKDGTPTKDGGKHFERR